jgi:glycosyltransferase involved in cell wall biosynthesis
VKTLYIPAPRKLGFINDTDHNYNFQLMKLADYDPELRIASERSLLLDARTYCRLALAILRRRYKLPIPRKWGWLLSQYYRMPSTGANLKLADAILAYERYPINAKLPVIWITTGPTDIERLRSRGVADRDIQQEIDFKREVNAQAAATVLTTQFRKRMFDEAVRPSRPTHVIPFFQPIDPISPSRFSEKWRHTSPTKLLFVGRAANAKGLPVVLDAYNILQKRYPEKVSLHVVSSMSDGPVQVPKLPGLVHDKQVSHQRALHLMREAHYLLMPSEMEPYGWVYIEAMSQGTIPVASNTPVQRELLNEGRAGWLVERSASAVAEPIALGIERAESARNLASQAMNLWRSRYAPGVVAGQFAALLHPARETQAALGRG